MRFSRSKVRTAIPLAARTLGFSPETVLALATAALALAVAIPPSAAQASTPMLLGAVGDTAKLSNGGLFVGTHAYGKLTGSVPTGRMVTMRADVSWLTVAAARPGSSTYADIVRWANTLKSRPGLVLFAYHHEPEASGSVKYGSPADYIAAYRHVVDTFRAQGVNNVEYVWQMTSWSFATNSGDRRYAAKWYPGSSFVDDVGSDAYNWYACGPGHGTWNELKAVVDPSLGFAQAHGKQLVVAEFASQPGARRATWLRNAHTYLVANQADIRGAYYFQHADTEPNRGCDWPLRTSVDIAAFAEMTQDRGHFVS